jgi:hypothetical protein
MMTRFLLLALLLAGGCSTAVQQKAAAPVEAIAACTLFVAGAEQPSWRQVQAEGFTFCVPESWRAAGRGSNSGTDARTWRDGSGSITWGTGAPPRRGRVGTAVVSVQRGQPLPAPPGNVQRATETIGGHPAQVWNNRFENTSYTGATWTTPKRVFLIGETQDPAAAAVHLQVYRTVRFHAP